jgi:hypothetical protein
MGLQLLHNTLQTKIQQCPHSIYILINLHRNDYLVVSISKNSPQATKMVQIVGSEGTYFFHFFYQNYI